MLRITVELIPAGNEARKRVLGVMHVARTDGNEQVADYKVVEMQTEASSLVYRVYGIAGRDNVFDFLRGLLQGEKP